MNFDASKLSKSKEAFVIAADSNQNIKKRNEIYARVPGDVFIPAGGRPYSVNNKNWRMFIGEDEKPTVRAIIEGANIFFTPEARTMHQEQVIIIIKDSSANKTGVICSSYEIMASLTMSEKEFLAIKDEYVSEVIQILRSKADAEAKLLFRAFVQADGSKTFVDLSLEISKEINNITDIMLDELSKKQDEVVNDEFYKTIVERHCPKILLKKYGKRVHSDLPDPHKIAIIASYIASYIVYNEGLGWLRTFPKEHWSTALKIYMEKDRLANDLVKSVGKSSIQDKDQVQAILAKSAARNLTMMELQKKFILN